VCTMTKYQRLTLGLLFDNERWPAAHKVGCTRDHPPLRGRPRRPTPPHRKDETKPPNPPAL
jgi:hypothetical protein